MKYYKFVIIIILSIVIVIFARNIINTLYVKYGTELSETQLEYGVNKIARMYTNLYAYCEILTDETKGMLGKCIDEKEDSSMFYNMTYSERVILFSGGEGLKKTEEPIQIYAMFECWMFLRNKKLPYDVIAIAWTYSSGGLDNTNYQMTIITKNEFENLYNSTDLSGMDVEQASRVLADKWMQETGYERLM